MKHSERCKNKGLFIHLPKHVFLRILLIYSIILLAAMPVNAQFYNGSKMDFGKNRIQYKPIEWSFYRFERMDVYFYSGGKELAKRTAQTAESTLAEYEQLFDYTLENRIQLLVFNRLSDLKQSNVGLGGQSIDNLGGTTRMVGSKVLLYFENGTASFVEQIRSGIAEAW